MMARRARRCLRALFMCGHRLVAGRHPSLREPRNRVDRSRQNALAPAKILCAELGFQARLPCFLIHRVLPNPCRLRPLKLTTAVRGLKGSDVQFLFEDYALDTDTRELKRGGELISVAPKVFDVLAYLVQGRERVISRDDLLKFVWLGRIVSESTLTSHINSVRKAVGDTGEAQHLVRTVARKGFRFVGEVREEQPPRPGISTKPAAQLIRYQRRDAQSTFNASAATLALPDKPSIAVMPFQNLSGAPEEDYFADGMVEDIIIALSRMRSLFVIARNSSFTYKGRATDVKQIGRELGVRYVLEGSVRRAANRVRIAGQLIETSTGAHIWADRFDGALDDIFRLQDQVTASVVGAITPKLEHAEIERATRIPTESLNAYDYFLRGMASYYRRASEDINVALRMFYKAIELDPEFASAFAMAAWCYAWRKINGWMTDRAEETAETARLARRAAELGPDDGVTLSRGGHALAFVVGDLDAAATFVNRALMLNPNLAGTWYASGWVSIFRGEPEVAIEHLAWAMRLSPLDPEMFRIQAGTAFAHLLAGRFDNASSCAGKALSDLPTYLTAVSILAASNALAGRMEEAHRAMAHLRQLDPLLCVSNLKAWMPLRRSEDFVLWSDGLRKAGLPE
jgi:TolB-like protein